MQMHEALQILLQEGRAHARNGDAVAVTKLEHRVAMHVGVIAAANSCTL